MTCQPSTERPAADELGYTPRLPALVDNRKLWEEGRDRHDMPDHRSGDVYRVADDLRLAMEVAMVTGRPLLLRGEPGTGKSAIAAYLARNLCWKYYEHVVTSATRAEDFLWEFDAVKRLSDAETEGKELDDFDYVQPGVLWWALDPETARLRGRPRGTELDEELQAHEPNAEVNEGRLEGHAVVLIDELDKADPDVPNGLLVPLGSGRFEVRETGTVVDAHEYERHHLPAGTGDGDEERGTLGRIMVMVTTNEERQLPPAFVRRCIVHSLDSPDHDTLVAIATLHTMGPGGGEPADDVETLFSDLARLLDTVRKELAAEGRERLPSTAEYLDAVRACLDLGVTPADPIWETIERATLRKPPPAL